MSSSHDAISLLTIKTERIFRFVGKTRWTVGVDIDPDGPGLGQLSRNTLGQTNTITTPLSEQTLSVTLLSRSRQVRTLFD